MPTVNRRRTSPLLVLLILTALADGQLANPPSPPQVPARPKNGSMKAAFGLVLLAMAPVLPMILKAQKLKQFDTGIRLHGSWQFGIMNTIVFALSVMAGMVLYVYTAAPSEDMLITGCFLLCIMVWHRFEGPPEPSNSFSKPTGDPKLREAATKAPTSDQPEDDDEGKPKPSTKPSPSPKPSPEATEATDLQECTPGEPAAAAASINDPLWFLKPPPRPEYKKVSAERAAAFFNTPSCSLTADNVIRANGVSYIKAEAIIASLKAHKPKTSKDNDVQALVKRLMHFSSIQGQSGPKEVTVNGVVHVFFDPAHHSSWVKAREMVGAWCVARDIQPEGFSCWTAEPALDETG